MSSDEKNEFYARLKEAEEYMNVNKSKIAQEIYKELYLNVRIFSFKRKDKRKKDS
jgi:hypothetical protein